MVRSSPALLPTRTISRPLHAPLLSRNNTSSATLRDRLPACYRAHHGGTAPLVAHQRESSCTKPAIAFFQMYPVLTGYDILGYASPGSANLDLS